MGMAAGQARLLSITSRMSDNELRAQIINNNKMRLATESSQVSEAYVNALNQAQMMFTNYDADNNTSYQQLTFNSLTSYNPYNNQYGLVNASGQILVSETDATNFMNANGDMEKFLSFYNLEQKTTYFEELEKYQGTATDAITGKTINNVPVMYTDTTTGEVGYTDSGYTWDQLEILFNGGVDKNGVKHSGYDTALYSAVYNNYVSYAERFDAAYTSFADTIGDVMSNKLESFQGSKLKTIYEKATGDGTTLQDSDYNTLIAIIEEAGTYALDTDEAQTYFANLATEVKNIKSGFSTSTLGSESNNDITFVANTTADPMGTLHYGTVTIGNSLEIVHDVTGYTFYELITNDDGTTTRGSAIPQDGSINGSLSTIYYEKYDSNGDDVIDDKDGTQLTTDSTDNNGFFTINGCTLKDLFDNSIPGGVTFTESQAITPEEQKSSVASIIEELQTAIFSYWSVDDPAFVMDRTDTDKESASHLAYRQAAAEFIVSLLNEGTNSNDYSVGDMAVDNATDKGSNFQYVTIKKGTETYYISLDDINLMATDPNSLETYMASGLPLYTYANSPSMTGNGVQFDQEEMQDLLDVIVLNNVMNTYGEPKVAWVDTINPDENGEAKYKWYSNLFTRMQNGFAVLQDGLASSNEWIQFALENGIVTMEQVDSEDNWNSMNYTNCSDITEQTNDKAVAIAEAEYNAAMNKIENKDKRYDLELKNIDTEHNSLQTEYDSIKTAIDKNIERTFKIYS